MAKAYSTSSRTFRKGSNGTVVLKGGNTKKVMVGHEYAVPVRLAGGVEVLRTATGKTVTSRRMK